MAREGICLGRRSPLGSRNQGSPRCPSESPEGLRLGRDQPGDLLDDGGTALNIFYSFFLPLSSSLYSATRHFLHWSS